MIGQNNTISFLSCHHENTRDTVALLTTKQSAAVVVGTFSYDLTLYASDISDRTADIHHQNLESEFQLYFFTV